MGECRRLTIVTRKPPFALALSFAFDQEPGFHIASSSEAGVRKIDGANEKGFPAIVRIEEPIDFRVDEAFSVATEAYHVVWKRSPRCAGLSEKVPILLRT